MNAIKVTIGNSYLHGLIEEFICDRVDITNKEEMEYCAEECVGAYLDMHADVIFAKLPDVNSDEIYDACYYTIEEVTPNEL